MAAMFGLFRLGMLEETKNRMPDLCCLKQIGLLVGVHAQIPYILDLALRWYCVVQQLEFC